jgi:hypothetical protein
MLAHRPDLPQAPVVPPVIPARLAHVLHVWRAAVSPHRRAAIAGSIVATLVAAAHLARVGTPFWRAAAATAIAVVAVVWLLRVAWERRVWRSPRRAARAAIRAVDVDLAERAARAADLVSAADTVADPLALGLAQLHIERVLASVGRDRIEAAARSRARAWQRAALALMTLSLAALTLAPLRFVEGIDVLLARAGRAPVPIDWVDAAVGEVQLPRYLRARDQMFMGLQRTSHPRGSVITLRGHAVHAGRRLVLTDGKQEVPFADDGRGGIAARWTLEDSVRLEVGARFGDVLIVQGEPLDVESIADEAPKVALEDAPRSVALAEAREIPMRYRVTDDHGLTQVDLVIRAGDKEERRVLARYQGQEVDEKGSVVISSGDPALRRAWVPVELAIEARDNDPITGPKWGRSASITVVPPAIGEEEAQRFEALSRLRDRAVDQLADRLTEHAGTTPAERRTHVETERARQGALREELDKLRAMTVGSRTVPGRLSAFLLGQVERLDRAVDRERSASSTAAAAKAHAQVCDTAGGAVLGMDGALRSIGAVDAMSVAKRLADVAQAGATGAELVQQGETDRGKARLDAALAALRGGARSLSRLEALGKDLGEVVDIGVRRIERAASANDYAHAQLAAEHLAARLRRPFPSFSGGGGRGSGGDGIPGPADEQDAASADAQFDAQQSEIDRIAREHASAMDELRDLLDKAMQDARSEGLRDAIREHADRVRQAVRGLPSDTSSISPVEAGAAMVRSNAEMMAESMERLAMDAAVAAGRNAVSAADHAQRMAAEERRLFGEESLVGPRIAQAKQTVQQEIDWLRDQIDRMQRQAADRSRDTLDRSAKQEDDFGRRVEEVGDRSRRGDAPLPQTSFDLLDKSARAMREAAAAFRAHDPQRGAERQRDAQRLLEMAQAAEDGEGSKQQGEPPPSGEQDASKGKPDTGRVGIPGADQFKGPERFRKRVLDGLGSSSDPRLREAVQRYAEGLLR